MSKSAFGMTLETEGEYRPGNSLQRIRRSGRKPCRWGREAGGGSNSDGSEMFKEAIKVRV